MADRAFLTAHEEKAEFNQYWYSSHTIQAMVEVGRNNAGDAIAYAAA